MTKFRNKALKDKLAKKQVVKKTIAARKVVAKAIPTPDTTNLQGKEAYSLPKWLRLVSMLNTLKLENQYYKSENQTMKELSSLINECAKENTYLTAQAIVYSRCVGEGMRSINQYAAVCLAKHASGAEWAQRFYGLWNKKSQSGGTIFRPDDIAEIVACYTALNSKTITNAMKKGFKKALEEMDSYSLLKYKGALLDIINLVHPDPKKSKAIVKHGRKNVSVFEAIMKGYPVSADTWEANQSEAGQLVAEAVKKGKITSEEAVTVLKEAKAENWKGLLEDGKLGILAALRNIRSVLKVVDDTKTVTMLCDLLQNGEEIRKGKVMPYQIDLAYEVVKAEFSGTNANKIAKALQVGYETALPNLVELLVGNNLVIIDLSGSMWDGSSYLKDNVRKTAYKSQAGDKALLIGATLAKATNADVIRFGSSAEYVNYNSKLNVFDLAHSMKKSMGGTSLSQAWDAASRSGKKYDRVFIISDNECNRGNSYASYTNYLEKVGNPYVYSVDLAAYGTQALVGPKVRYYFGFGTAMFDDIATSEFNPMYHLEKIRKIKI